MALTAQLQQAWKTRTEAYLDKVSVFAPALTNNHYEGDLKANATLNILSIGDVTEAAYSGAWVDGAWETLSTTGITFTADQKRLFHFNVADTDTLGSAMNLVEQGSKRAAYAVMNRMDTFLAALHSTITTNVYGSDASPITVGFDSSAGEVLPSVALSYLNELLASANADQSAVNCVVPVWLGSMLLQEMGARNTSAGDSSMVQGVSTGKLPITAAGFREIYVSNNVVNTGSALYKVMAGSPSSSITLAKTLEKIETGRIQNDFADYVKGLFVYGAKIPYESHMALGTFNQGTRRQA